MDHDGSHTRGTPRSWLTHNNSPNRQLQKSNIKYQISNIKYQNSNMQSISNHALSNLPWPSVSMCRYPCLRSRSTPIRTKMKSKFRAPPSALMWSARSAVPSVLTALTSSPSRDAPSPATRLVPVLKARWVREATYTPSVGLPLR